MIIKAEDLVKGKTEQLNDRIKALTDKPHKLSMDLQGLQEAQTEIEKVKSALAAFHAMQDARKDAQKKSAAAIDHILGEAGAPELAEQLKAKAVKDIEAGDPQMADMKAKAEAAQQKAAEKAAAEAAKQKAAADAAAKQKAAADSAAKQKAAEAAKKKTQQGGGN